MTRDIGLSGSLNAETGSTLVQSGAVAPPWANNLFFPLGCVTFHLADYLFFSRLWKKIFWFCMPLRKILAPPLLNMKIIYIILQLKNSFKKCHYLSIIWHQYNKVIELQPKIWYPFWHTICPNNRFEKIEQK